MVFRDRYPQAQDLPSRARLTVDEAGILARNQTGRQGV
jgi:hypothetical protein